MIAGRAIALLRANPSIVAPGLVAALVAAPVQWALAPADALDDDLAHRLLRSIAVVCATIVSIAYTTGMADVAWRCGRATLADGARALRPGGGTVVAVIALFVLGSLAATLAPFTFGLSLVTFAFFCIYAPASAVSGERPGLRAVAESAAFAVARPLPPLCIALGVVIAAGVAGSLATPIAGPLVIRALAAGVVIQFAATLAALVALGDYRTARGTGVPA